MIPSNSERPAASPGSSKAAQLSIRIPGDEAAELARLATERGTDVHVILLAQLGPLRKLLQARLTARNCAQDY